MNIIRRVLITVLLLSSASMVAQAANRAKTRTVSQVVEYWVTNTVQLVVPVANAMPEGKYSFAPFNGEFSEVRTFAE